MSHKKHLLLLALLAIIFLPSLFFSKNTPIPASAADNQLSGYAWSSNIGWINFNGDGGNVTIDSAGNLIGYAWSSNIGWIYFGGDPNMAGGITSAPASPKTWAFLNRTSGDLTGWARACSVFQSGCNGALNNNSIDGVTNGGWDGWISLSGSGYGVKSQLVSGTRTFYGYAWGGGSSPTTDSSPQSPGWISFNYQDSGNPPTLPPGGTPGAVTVIETPAVPSSCSVALLCQPWDDKQCNDPEHLEYQWCFCSTDRNLSVLNNRSCKLCPDGTYTSQDKDCPFYDLYLVADSMSTKLTSAATSIVYKSGSTTIYPVVKIGSTGASCNADITLSIEKILKPDGSALSLEYYSGYSFVPNPLAPANYANGSTLNLTLKKKPNSVLPPLISGTYVTTIRAIPAGGACGGELPKKNVNITISSSGGTYIEQ